MTEKRPLDFSPPIGASSAAGDRHDQVSSGFPNVQENGKRDAARRYLSRVASTLAICAFSGCLGFGTGGVEVGGVDAPLDPDCQSYDRAYVAWTAVGAAASGLAGAAGTALAVWPDPTRDELIGVGVSAAALGVLGTTAQLLAGMYAQRWVERCGGGEVLLP